MRLPSMRYSRASGRFLAATNGAQWCSPVTLPAVSTGSMDLCARCGRPDTRACNDPHRSVHPMAIKAPTALPCPAIRAALRPATGRLAPACIAACLEGIRQHPGARRRNCAIGICVVSPRIVPTVSRADPRLGALFSRPSPAGCLGTCRPRPRPDRTGAKSLPSRHSEVRCRPSRPALRRRWIGRRGSIAGGLHDDRKRRHRR